MKRLLLALSILVPTAPAVAQAPAPTSATASVNYADQASWLCLPGRGDACGRPLPTTDLNAGGYGPPGETRPAENPAVDCFYIYPTVSRDPEMNSDMNAGPEEQAVAAVQLARFSSVCRTYAPLYRSATLSMT